MSFSSVPYRGRKAALFARLAAGDVVPLPPRNGSSADGDDSIDIHWRTFYRYIRAFCKDGYPIRHDTELGGWVMVTEPAVSDNDDWIVTVVLTRSEADLLCEIAREFGGGREASGRTKLGRAIQSLEAAMEDCFPVEDFYYYDEEE